MVKIADVTWDWLDAVWYCHCSPVQDRCEKCKAERARERQRQAPSPKVFRGQPTAVSKKLDFE